MARRKTVRISYLVDKANRMLKESTCGAGDRMGICLFLEDVLHETSGYAGYRYLDESEVPAGHKPGIIRGEDPADNVFPDESRREYILNGWLRESGGRDNV